MAELTRYTYRTVAPSPLRYYEYDLLLEGHRMGYYVRTDTMIPTGKPGRVSYCARCTCKWIDHKPDTAERYYVPKKNLETRFRKHIAKVKDQGEQMRLSNV